MYWLDWRELEKQNDWGVRDKDDATAALWNAGADVWEKRSSDELAFALDQTNALNISAEDHVMDVCCGTGPLTLNLSRRAKKVTAFDFNENMLAYVRRKAADEGITNIDYLQGNFNLIRPGIDFEPADIAVTRHSPAQGNILKFSRFAKKYCYSLALVYRPDDFFPMPGRGNKNCWFNSAEPSRQYAERPDGRKFGLNITFNLLYESGADPEIFYVHEIKTLKADSYEELAAAYFPSRQTPEILEYVKGHSYECDGSIAIDKKQTMSITGWDPRQIDWDSIRDSDTY